MKLNSLLNTVKQLKKYPMEFKQIKTFLQVAELGSFTRAAEHLCLSRAMVSIQIKQLEENLGVTLFHRNTRQIELTDAGKSFYQDCQAIQQSYQQAVEKIQHNDAQLNGTLRIGSTYEFGMQFIAPILTKFCQKHSNLQIHYDVNSSINDLIADQLDIVIRLGNLPDSSLKSRKIGQFQIILVASPDFLEKYPVNQLDDLLNVPWITQTQWQNHHFTLTNHTTQQDFHFVPPSSKHQTNAGGLTHLMAVDGLGLTICPLWLVENDLNQGKLIRVLPDYSLPMQDIHALYLHQKHLPNKTRLFIDYLKQHYFNS